MKEVYVKQDNKKNHKNSNLVIKLPMDNGKFKK